MTQPVHLFSRGWVLSGLVAHWKHTLLQVPNSGPWPCAYTGAPVGTADRRSWSTMTAASQDLTIVGVPAVRSLTLSVSGEIDLATAPQLAAAVTDALGSDTDVVSLDLTGVTFVDSTGLHVLLAAQRRADLTGRRLVLAGTSRAVDRLLTLTGTDNLFNRQEQRTDVLPSGA
jgi:anti-sigma B factor antagonist